MFIEIENLAGEENPGSERDGAGGVQSASHRREAIRHESARDVKDGDEQDDERESRLRRHRVPVGGDEEQHAGADGQGTERDRDENRPPHPGRPRALALERPNTIGRLLIDDSRTDPLDEPLTYIVSHEASRPPGA